MVVSLGRTLWNLGQRREPGAGVQHPTRPAGPLVWLHVPSAGPAAGMIELARRLVEEDGVHVLVTCPEALVVDPGVLFERPPNDAPGPVRAFLDHWYPSAIVFSDGEIRPALIHEAQSRKIPMQMADARMPQLAMGREGWFPGLLRSSLLALSRISTLDETAARAFRKAGAVPAGVTVTGRMEERSAVLRCLEAERESLAHQMQTRPAWFAVAVPEAEEMAVLSSHRTALGLAHRLLLILMPEHPDHAPDLAKRIEAEGWELSQRSNEEEPEEGTEIYLVADPEELGLWYRLAPISFLGGSLAGTGAIRSPLEAAALGSAILHGPRPGAHGVALGRLGAARAARAVASARDLSEALGDLLSPDRTARLAQAAWTVASDGAEVTDALIEDLRRILERTA